jgi:transposase
MNFRGFPVSEVLWKKNARKQTLEQLHERRKQVVRLHKKAIKIMQIVSMTGLSYPAVRATIDLFEADGWLAIRPTSRGRARGDGRRLSELQEDTIRRTIIDKRPEQVKMDFFLWSRAAVGQLIEQEYGIKLHIRSVGKYLARWGFTPQKPIKRAYESSESSARSYPREESQSSAIGAIPEKSPAVNAARACSCSSANAAADWRASSVDPAVSPSSCAPSVEEAIESTSHDNSAGGMQVLAALPVSRIRANSSTVSACQRHAMSAAAALSAVPVV